ncbi:MAG: oxidoreductase [Dehalococcoidia bacterium]|nr:oxidoreductase [Dehalococcoidia bacterium]
MSKLFSSIQMRGEVIPNRVFVSPMCQYSCDTEDGKCNTWHVVHLGTRAVGGAGLVMIEATAVQPVGRITPWDAGLWEDSQIESLATSVEAIVANGSVPAIQLAHAGRKASHDKPWNGGGFLTEQEKGWQSVGASALPFDEDSAAPRELNLDEIDEIVQDFGKSAQRSVDAGIKVIELHMAHGYLGCSFMSPLSNKRSDRYGGSLENRVRFARETTRAVRHAIPDRMPLLVRVSATEYMDDGWDIEECVQLCEWLKDDGVDMIDCSSGGNSLGQHLTPFAGYQVNFAERIRKEAGIMTGAVGLITDANQAEQILVDQQADVVLLGRELLRNPYWPLQAQMELDGAVGWPSQYLRVREIRQFLDEKSGN